MENVEQLADTFKALSDPVRLRLIKLLVKKSLRKDLGVCDLARKLGISQPNVSHHLKILKTSGIVRCEKRECFSYYTLNGECLAELASRLVLEMKK
jgi:ArsR family transcriptional regulator